MKSALVAAAVLAVPLVALPLFARADVARQCEIDRRVGLVQSSQCAQLDAWAAWAGTGATHSAGIAILPQSTAPDETTEALTRLVRYFQAKDVVSIGQINPRVTVFVTKTECQADEGVIAFIRTETDAGVRAKSGCAVRRGDTVQVTVGDNVHAYSEKSFRPVK